MHIIVEAEYAYKLQRPVIPVRVEPDYTPTGWLGMILGFRMIFDLAVPALYQENSSKMIDELGGRGLKVPYKGNVLSSLRRFNSTTVSDCIFLFTTRPIDLLVTAII